MLRDVWGSSGVNLLENQLVKLALKFTNGLKSGKRACKCEDAKIVILSDFIDLLCKYKGFDKTPNFLFSIQINSISGNIYDFDITLSTGAVTNYTVDTSIYTTIPLVINYLKILLEASGFIVSVVNSILYVYIDDVTYINATVISNADEMEISNLSDSLDVYLDKINCISCKELCNLLTTMEQFYKEC